MFYKLDENGVWWTGTIIHLPNGVTLSSENKVNQDGWEWHDEAPDGYVNIENIEE